MYPGYYGRHLRSTGQQMLCIQPVERTTRLAQHDQTASMNTIRDTESHAQTPSLPVRWHYRDAVTEWVAQWGESN